MTLAVVLASAAAVVCCFCLLAVASLRFARACRLPTARDLEAERQHQQLIRLAAGHEEAGRELLGRSCRASAAEAFKRADECWAAAAALEDGAVPDAEPRRVEAKLDPHREHELAAASQREARATQLERLAEQQEAAGAQDDADVSRSLASALRLTVERHAAVADERLRELERLHGSLSARMEGIQRRRSFVAELRAAADRLDAKAYDSRLKGYPAAAESEAEQAEQLRAAAGDVSETGELPDWVPESVIAARVAELMRKGGEDETEASDDT